MEAPRKTDVLLCGDIGGTHTRFALVRPGAPDVSVATRTYPSRDYTEFQPLVDRFLEDARADVGDFAVRGAAFGIPGPVSATSELLWMVNLPWRIRVAEVARALKLPRVRFLNDFAAVALAIPRIDKRYLHPLVAGSPDPHGPIVVMGAGTGLGECFLVWTERGHIAIACEGDAVDFSPRGALQEELLAHLRKTLGAAGTEAQVSWEAVLSGPGLVNLYRFFRDAKGMAEAPTVRAALSDDAPAAITRFGLADPPDPVCARALDLFCSLYAGAARNLALQVVATGGVYLAGGVTQHVLPLLDAGDFRATFENHPSFGELLRGIPVHVVTHPNPGLLGAALAAEEDLAHS